MTDLALFDFISSYQGQHDYRRRADGRRYRRLGDAVTLTTTDWRPAPAEIVEEWHRYRVAQRAEFSQWCALKGMNPEPVRAEAWPELAEQVSWMDDPTDDLAWWNYQAGYELAHEHHAGGVRATLPAFHGRPFRDGYADGWQTATDAEPARY